MMLKKSRRTPSNFLIHVWGVFAILCSVVPFILLISISFSAESDVLRYGYSFIPRNFTLDAYKTVFEDSSALIDAYGVTIISAFGGQIISTVVTAMLAYTLSRSHFVLKKFITYMLLITMIFSGGLIPTYIVRTQLLGLQDNIWVYLFGGIISAYTVFVYRTFFKGIPVSLIESAELDGASEAQMLVKIIVPLSTPVLATYTFTGIVGRWNDFTTTMYYIQDPKLYTLQFMLQQILKEAEYLKQLQKTMGIVGVKMPSETLKFAICVLASLPMLLVFPYFQKYFSKGMVVGAVKG